MDKFLLQHRIYSNALNFCQVYSAIEIATNKEVCIKRTMISSSCRLGEVEREALALAQCRHPGVCALYSCFHDEDADGRCFCLVMEKLESDLDRETEKRRPKYRFWSEDALWRMLREVTETLAFLQSKVLCTQDISHRDIKPHNLFLSRDGHVKLGDFGSTTDVQLDSSLTLQGTPIYLSPKLRKSYYEMMKNPENVTARHNPYKSDVFSLGISFVHVALLEPPVELATLKGFSRKRNQCLDRMNVYSKDFKGVLRLMLEKREEKRPDFLQLLQIVRELQPLPQGKEKPCINCSRLTETEDPAAVKLLCGHCFCSRECFCAQTQSTAVCRECSAAIDAGLIQEINSARDQEDLERANGVCAECKQSAKIVEITQCAHQYCWNCVSYWRQNYVKKPLECPKCGRPLKTAAIRWMRSGCSIL